MIGKLSSTIGVTLEATELRDVYRLPTKPDQANTALVAEFSSTLIRDNFLTAAKNHKLASIRYKTEQLNSSHLGLEGSNSDIYISEHLTPLASRLFFLAREFRKTMGYDYCWTSNGLVYLRKKQGEPYVLIKSEDQLHLLKNKWLENYNPDFKIKNYYITIPKLSKITDHLNIVREIQYFTFQHTTTLTHKHTIPLNINKRQISVTLNLIISHKQNSQQYNKRGAVTQPIFSTNFKEHLTVHTLSTYHKHA